MHPKSSWQQQRRERTPFLRHRPPRGFCPPSKPPRAEPWFGQIVRPRCRTIYGDMLLNLFASLLLPRRRFSRAA